MLIAQHCQNFLHLSPLRNAHNPLKILKKAVCDIGTYFALIEHMNHQIISHTSQEKRGQRPHKLGQKSRFILYVLIVAGFVTIPLPKLIHTSAAHIPQRPNEQKLPWVILNSHNDTEIQKLPTSYYKPTVIHNEVNRTNVLKDPINRISKDFKVPKKLEPRVSFWFDIYTKYNSDDHVIHHSEYPWIVFHIFNTKKIMGGKEHHWTKYHRAKRAISQKASQIRRTLKRLAKKKNYKNLKGLERTLYNKLNPVRGKRKNIFAFAAKKVRSQAGQRDFFLKGLKNSTKYMAYIEGEFKKQNLPWELTRLPFVESSFNEAAQSKVGASGIWQIMPATGRDYIRVTRYIDERNSPLKATHMAAKLLKNYKKQLKQWPVTITAYNHGIGSMKKAIKKLRTSYLHRIIDRHKSRNFGFASKNFYTSFLAALYAEKYCYEIFKHEKIVKEPLIKREVVRLNKRIRTLNLLKTLQLSKEEFILYNLDLKKALAHNTHLPKNLEIHLPFGHNHKIKADTISQLKKTKG